MKYRIKIKITIVASFVVLHSVSDQNYVFGIFDEFSLGKNDIIPDNGGTISIDGKAIDGYDQSGKTGGTKDS